MLPVAHISECFITKNYEQDSEKKNRRIVLVNHQILKLYFFSRRELFFGFLAVFGTVVRGSFGECFVVFLVLFGKIRLERRG